MISVGVCLVAAHSDGCASCLPLEWALDASDVTDCLWRGARVLSRRRRRRPPPYLKEAGRWVGLSSGWGMGNGLDVSGGRAFVARRHIELGVSRTQSRAST